MTIKLQTAGAYCDSRNPAKRIEVREKIRQSKLGVKRNDMLNKKYFGADTAKIEMIQKKVFYKKYILLNQKKKQK